MEMQVGPLISGTIVKIYNSNRGQDYVIIGQSKQEQKLVMVKNSAITNDGSLFKQTKLYFLDLVPMFKETDPFYFAPKIKRVVGHRNLGIINRNILEQLNFSWYSLESTECIRRIIASFEALKIKDEIYPSLDVPDINKVIRYA